MAKSIFVRWRTWRLFASMAGVALLVSCSPTPATEIVVRIDSDMVPGSELTSVALLVYRDGARDHPMVSHTYALDGRDYLLPGEVGLTPLSAGDTRRIIVEVTADVRDGTDFSQRAITQFEAGRRLLLVMFLARRCQTTMCPAGRSCGADGTCVEDLRGSLPGFVPSDGAIDRVPPAEESAMDAPATDIPVSSGDASDADDASDATGADGAPDARDAANPFPSTGAEGAFPPPDAATDAGQVFLLSPGIHNFTTVRIPLDVRVVTNGVGVLDIRATGAVVIEGTIDVSGGPGRGNPANAGLGGCQGCGAALGDTAAGGIGGTGTAGRPGSSFSPGGHFGGGSGSVDGSGGGGGGYCGGGGGYRLGASGGNGASFMDTTLPEEGGPGGTTARTQGGGGGSMSTALAMIYHGIDGAPAPAGCATQACGGGGGGSIGLRAALDLPVSLYFRGGSGGGGGGHIPPPAIGGSGSGGGGGGGGGGVLRIASPVSILLSRDGSLLAAGGDGGSGYAPYPTSSTGGGGGGSGGVIYLASPSLTLFGTASVAGGGGGLAGRTQPCAVPGGAGGLGRIRLSVDPSLCRVTGTIAPPMPTAGCVTSPDGGVPGEVFVGRWPD